MQRKSNMSDNKDVIARVQQMEQYMDEVSEALRIGPNKVKEDRLLRKKIKILTDYMDSGQWLADYEADERGELPTDLKRGVLSQDGLYNLICGIEEMQRKTITFKEVDKSYFEVYDKIPMNVDVCSEYKIRRVNNGLGGILFEEVSVEPYVKNLGQYECAATYEECFDISNWRFYMAFEGKKAIGAEYVIWQGGCLCVVGHTCGGWI